MFDSLLGSNNLMQQWRKKNKKIEERPLCICNDELDEDEEQEGDSRNDDLLQNKNVQAIK